MRDLDDDGKPEIIFGGGSAYSLGAPRSGESRWRSGPRTTSRKPGERVAGHGIGVGDVNSDGASGHRGADWLVRAAAEGEHGSAVDASPGRVRQRAAARSACTTSTATGSRTS